MCSLLVVFLICDIRYHTVRTFDHGHYKSKKNIKTLKMKIINSRFVQLKRVLNVLLQN